MSKFQSEEEKPREQWAKQSDDHRTDFARARKPFKFQLAAWALWIAGLAVALGAAFCASGGVQIPVLTDLPALTVALAVVVDLILVLAAQRFWRKATALKAERGQSLVGVVMACLAFAPMCLFFLMAKNASGRTRAAAVVAALVSVALIVAVCLIGGSSEAVPVAQ